VNTHSKITEKIQPFPALTLFDWRQVVVRPPANRAAQYVMRRYRVAPHMAEVIAVLAGLGGGDRH
jgi:hypothetical protein